MSDETQPGDSSEPEKPESGEAENEKIEKRWRLSNETLSALTQLIVAIAAVIAAAHGHGGLTGSG